MGFCSQWRIERLRQISNRRGSHSWFASSNCFAELRGEFVAPATAPLELERLVRFDDKTFLRFLTVQLDNNVKDLEATKEAAEARLTKRQELVAAAKQEKVRR